MRRFAYQKLVRDLIPLHIEAGGEAVNYRALNDDEYLIELIKKVREEASELAQADPSQLLNEIADIQEILDCLLDLSGSSNTELKAAQEQKRAKHGSFSKRFYIEHVELSDGNQWINHYLANPDRYPELTTETD
jgi:predicted house-cleaning noncanonical NTP pyrophosphatase (MazG superfamily)